MSSVRRTPAGTLIALAYALAFAAPAPAIGGVFDHLKCYKIRDTLTQQAYIAQMTDTLGGDQCTLGRAVFFCAAAEKTAVVPAPPGGGPGGTPSQSFICYKARCRYFAPETLVEDQFGRRTVRFSGGRLVCAPTNTNASAPTTTTTTTLPTCTCAVLRCHCSDGGLLSASQGDACGSTCCAQARERIIELCTGGGVGPGDCPTTPCEQCLTGTPCQ